jgi:hypothetical protein
MTTFLLSQKINTLFGILISLYVCILTRRLVHPTSPVLLTKNGPLKTIPFRARRIAAPPGNPLGNAVALPVQSLRIS